MEQCCAYSEDQPVVLYRLSAEAALNTAQKNEFSTKDFFSKCNQIFSFLRIWSHLLKKSLMGNFNFCAVK